MVAEKTPVKLSVEIAVESCMGNPFEHLCTYLCENVYKDLSGNLCEEILFQFLLAVFPGDPRTIPRVRP